MKLSLHHEAPVQEKDYEGLAVMLRHKDMDKKSVAQVLKDDPKFAEWFNGKK